MTNSTEAPASVTYSITTKDGFNCLFTIREESGIKLLEKMVAIEKTLLANSYKPQEKKSFGGKSFPKKEQELAPGKKCPVCGGDLVVKTNSKTGKKFAECINRKYDFQSKQTTGCTYVDWNYGQEDLPTKVEEDYPIPENLPF